MRASAAAASEGEDGRQVWRPLPLCLWPNLRFQSDARGAPACEHMALDSCEQQAAETNKALVQVKSLIYVFAGPDRGVLLWKL
jgi:hypothetical protein